MAPRSLRRRAGGALGRGAFARAARRSRGARGRWLSFFSQKRRWDILAFLELPSVRAIDPRRSFWRRAIEAKWASLNTWHVFDRTASHVRAWSAGSGGAHEEFSWPLGPETTPVSGSRSLSTVRNFLRAHDLGFAVTLPRGDGRTLVLWSDIRFCWDPTLPDARKLEPIVQSAAGDKRIACALWFGGELDSDGRPRLEVVKVGGFTQTRAPAG